MHNHQPVAQGAHSRARGRRPRSVVLVSAVALLGALTGSSIPHASALAPPAISFSSSSVAFGAGISNGPESVAVGDFNGRGPRDLVVADAGTSQVNVLLNQGRRGFTDGFTSGTQP